MATEFIQKTIHLSEGKSLYFASDFHLGVPNRSSSLEREKKIISWLNHVQHEAQIIFLVGDLFDFWFEYKQVVPRGYVRFLGKLAEISDQGTELVVFTGNHDMWMRDYFEKELNAQVSRKPISYRVHTTDGHVTSLLTGHGDGLGPGDFTYKKLKVLFESPIARWAFRQLHPDVALRIANAWSQHSRLANNQKGEDTFKGEEQEWLYLFCKETENLQHHDLYIFGHRHLALDMSVEGKTRYINLGEWVNDSRYFRFNSEEASLKKW
jgi:UDP-2,3-diacylglucosamine hydrolase